MKRPSAHTQSLTAEQTTTASLAHFPYPIIYTADFEIGKETYTQIVLDLWKTFDDNTLDKGAPVFAEEVIMEFCDGTVYKGSKSEFMAFMQQQRDSCSSFESTIEAVISLKPKGKEESWVCVWGLQTSVTKDNKKQQVYINENWMFDKEGKVSYIKQFNALTNNPT